MQVPLSSVTDTRPAALVAKPGTWPSCAVEARAPLHPGAFTGKGARTSGGLGSRSIPPHSIEKFGQDRRYGKIQRGRAVACA